MGRMKEVFLLQQQEQEEREALDFARREQDFINDRNRKTNTKTKDHGNRTDKRSK